MIKTSGFQQTFFTFGLIQGLIIFALGWFLQQPGKGEVQGSKVIAQSRRDYTLTEALQTPVFYLLLLMFICTVTGGLMAVAQLSLIAQDLGVKDHPINLGFMVMAALPFALMLDRIMNGFSRPFFGWISDRIGREKTMFIAFTLEGLGIIALGKFGAKSLGLPHPVRGRVPGLGRGLQPVQRDCGGYLRHEARRQDLRPALLREGRSRRSWYRSLTS
jgi:MFS family permease